MKIGGVISQSSNMVMAICHYFEYVFESKKDNCDLFVVDVSSLFFSSENLKALEYQKETWKVIENCKNTVLLMFVGAIESLKKEEFLRDMLAMPNVASISFLDLSQALILADEVEKREKNNFKEYLLFLKVKSNDSIFSGLKHGIENSFGEDLKERIRKARATGYFSDSISNEEVESYLRSWRPEAGGPFEGVSLDGIYIDAYGTLFNENWEIRQSVLSTIRGLSVKLKKEIFIISDSEKSKLIPLLNKNGIKNFLISKYALRGAKLEIVVDDYPQEKFMAEYSITPIKFINVKDLKLPL